MWRLSMPSLNINILDSIFKNFEIEDNDSYVTFIETGTSFGNNIRIVQPYFEVLHTIEIKKEIYDAFDSQHPKYENVIRHLGDSCTILPEILKSLSEDNKCIFWLDGHYSSGESGRGEKDVPLIEECKIIDEIYKSKYAVILIDDYMLFGTSKDENWLDITDDNVINSFDRIKILNTIIGKNDMMALFVENSEYGQ